MKLTWIKDFKMDISSIEIREKIGRGDQLGNELPQPIWDYIQENNLYGNE